MTTPMHSSSFEKEHRLRFEVTVKGEPSHITRFGYHVTAGGRALGAAGINEP